FLSGKPGELETRLTARMNEAATAEQYELAAKLRDQLITLRQMLDKQRIATTDNEDADVFGYHYENGMLAVNLFHMRGGKIVDRRDFFWEDMAELVLDAPASAHAHETMEAEAEAEPSLEPDPAYPAPEIAQDLPVTEERSVLAEPPGDAFNGTRTTDTAQPLATEFSPAAFFSSLL